jgi:tetratricopeptide (TPR) repeat protein
MFFVTCHNIVFYLYKILWPAHLSPHYPYPKPLGFASPMVAIGVAGTVLLIAALLASWRKTRAAVAGWLFFFVAIFPAIGVIGFTVVVASDKFAYLPSVGLLVALAGLGAWLWDRWRGRARTGVRLAMLGVVVAMAAGESVGARTAIANWRDTFTLNEHMLALTPNAAWVHNCTAVNLIRKSRGKTDIDEAEAHLKRALEFDGNYNEAHNSLGVIYLSRREYEKAIAQFEAAIRAKRNYDAAIGNLGEAHNELGAHCLAQGRIDEAIRHLDTALKINPANAAARHNLDVARQAQARQAGRANGQQTRP